MSASSSIRNAWAVRTLRRQAPGSEEDAPETTEAAQDPLPDGGVYVLEL